MELRARSKQFHDSSESWAPWIRDGLRRAWSMGALFAALELLSGFDDKAEVEELLASFCKTFWPPNS
jgi:hypothetical protein